MPGSGWECGVSYGSGRDDVYAVQQIVANATALGSTVVDYLLPDAINPDRAGSFSVFLLNCMVNYTNGAGFDGATFQQFTATTIAHEAGHTLGLVHVQGIQPGTVTTTVTSATGTSNVVTVASVAGMRVGTTLYFGTSNTKATILSGVGTTLTLSNPILTTNGETVTLGVYNIITPPASGVADIMAYNYGSAPDQASNGFVISLNALKLAADMTVTDAAVQDALNYYKHSVDTGGAGASVNNVSDDPDDVSVAIPGKSLLVSDATTGDLVNGIDFGSQTIVGASAVQSFFVTNLGTQQAVTITGAILTGSADFNLTLPTGFAGQLAPGASVSFSVQYTAELGPSDGTLTINSDAGPITISLTGSGTESGPAAQVDSSNNNLGGDIIGNSVTNANAIVVNNDGSQPLTISGLTFVYGGNAFSVNGVPANLAAHPITIAPGGSYDLSVTYSPSTANLERARIALTTNDPSNPTLNVNVVGTGMYYDSVGNWGNDYVTVTFPEQNNAVLRTVSDGKGHFSFFWPASTPYKIYVFDPLSGLIAIGQGMTSVSGQPTDLTSTLSFEPSTAPDTGGDGLPDDVEFAIGLNPHGTQTSPNGLDYFTQVILNHTNPQTAAPLVTGVVATLPLQGSAMDVTLVGSTTSSGGQTAYIATGSYGLAVVDASNFQQPVLLSQLALPGGSSNSVAVDSNLQIAAVASGTALNLVDVSNPKSPRLIQSINIPATNVKIYQGVVYAVNGNNVTSFDLLTGIQIDQENFTGGYVNGLSIDQGNLYVLVNGGTASHTIYKVQLTDGSLAAPQYSLVVTGHPTFGSMYIFAADGYIYVGAADNNDSAEVPGVEVIQDTGTALNLVGPSSGITAFNVTVNSNGLAVFCGGLQFSSTVGLLNLSNPTVTNSVVTTFNTPGTAYAVALAQGIGYVADGSAGLVVLNYLPFDTTGIKPTASLALPPSVVVATGQDGNPEIVEGATVPILATANSNVQVSNVELLVDGKVVQNAVSYPFALSTVLPSIAQAGSNQVTIQVEAFDTGGNVGLSNVITVDLIHDTTQPVLVSSNVGNGTIVGNKFSTVTLQFSKPMSEASFTAGSVYLIGPNHSTINFTAASFRFDDRIVSLTFPQLSTLGAYQLVLTAALTDRPGNALKNAPITYSFTVEQFSAVWVGRNGGDWNTPSNWDINAVPGPTDDVLISVPGNPTITFSSGTETVDSIYSTDPFTMSGGSLTVTKTIQVDNTFTMTGGDLIGATIDQGNGGQGLTINDPNYYSYPTLDGATINANVSVAGPYSTYGGVTILDGLTLNGNLTSSSGTIYFTGNQTLATTGASPVDVSPAYVNVDSNSTLTIAAGIVIQGGSFSGGGLVNQGVINSSSGTNKLNMSSFSNTGAINASGGSLSITGLAPTAGNANPLGNFTFSGSTLSLSGTNYTVNSSFTIGVGQRLTLAGTFTAGSGVTITDIGGTLGLGTPGDPTQVWTVGSAPNTVVVTNGTLNLGGAATSLAGLNVTNSALDILGTYTAGQLQNLLAGNTITIGAGGVLDDTGGVLNLAGNLTLAGGTLKGGTVNGSSTAEVVVNLTGYYTTAGTLDGVTLNANLDFTQGDYLTLVVRNGLTLSATTTMSIGGPNSYGATLDFQGANQTLASTAPGAAILLGGSYTAVNVDNSGNPASLTIGAGVTIHGGAATIGSTNAVTLINQGVIDSDGGGTITVNAATLQNQGTLSAGARQHPQRRRLDRQRRRPQYDGHGRDHVPDRQLRRQSGLRRGAGTDARFERRLEQCRQSHRRRRHRQLPGRHADFEWRLVQRGRRHHGASELHCQSRWDRRQPEPLRHERQYQCRRRLPHVPHQRVHGQRQQGQHCLWRRPRQHRDRQRRRLLARQRQHQRLRRP